MPDKPAYRPGQPLHPRALALDAVTLRPADDAAVTFSIHDAAGRQIAHETRRASEFGVAFADVTLPETAVSGAYTLRAAVGDTLAERAVFVDDYTLPAFRLAITPERSFALSGDVVMGARQRRRSMARRWRAPKRRCAATPTLRVNLWPNLPECWMRRDVLPSA